MKAVGNTPLIRAKSIEKHLGIGEIYIKLEGNNPSGHKYARIARVLIKDALSRGQSAICVDGTYAYICSVRHFAQEAGLEVCIPLFKSERWKQNALFKAHLVDFKAQSDSDRMESLRAFAAKKNIYLALEGSTQTHVSQMAMEALTEEIIHRLDGRVDTLFLQWHFGYTLTSVYNVYLKHWMREDVERFPRFMCAFNMPINGVKPDAVLQEEALRVSDEIQAETFDISPEHLKQAVYLLRRYEHLKVSEQEAYAFAAFLQAQTSLQQGVHVIVLNDAKSMIEIEAIEDDRLHSRESLIQMTRQWLKPYKDSEMETGEALDNALEKGFVLTAVRNERLEGICIIVNLGFEVFIPKYHLAYIGTDGSSKGRGVASALIEQALEVTEGNLSLHVDLDNKRAKKLYEQYGFEHCYNRMIYKK